MTRSTPLIAAAVAAFCASVAAVAAPPARHAASVEQAREAIQRSPQAALAALDDRFEAFDVVRDADGSAHVRFDRRFKGLRVIGGDMVIHLDSRGALKGVSKSLSRQVEVDASPQFDRGAAEALAASRFAKKRSEAAAHSELVVYARGATPVLAWDVLVRGQQASGLPSEEHLIVDAQSGTLLDRWDDVQTADALGSGTGFYTGTIPLHADQLADGSYQMVDHTRGGQTITDMQNKGNIFLGGPRGPVMTDADNVWGSGDGTDRTTAGVDAAFGIGKTWDYYLETFDRHGIADDGKGGEGRVHWGKKIANAGWSDSCFCMRYGDGDGKETGPFVAIDVAGHEMTHGVTNRSARLTYSGESGGLNEATSDIFGSMVEYYAQAAFDPPDYKIGEQLYLDQSTGKALRYMYHPSTDSANASTQSSDCWYPGVGNIDVHYSSGVANHFFYLLAEGPAPAGGPASPICKPGDQKQATGTAPKPLKGIGRSAAQSIWYRALTVYLTANSNYAAARAATIDAATDLFGANSREVKGVMKAWTAVNVN